MARDSQPLDRNLTGQTNPRRHHLFRLLLMLSLVAACALIAVIAGNIVLRAGKAGVDAIGARRHSDEVVLDPVAAEDQEADDTQKDEVPEPEAHVDLMMIGDILMHTGVIETGFQEDGSYNFDHMFAHLSDDIQAADIRVLNQETPLAGAAFGYSGYPAFNAPQAVGDAEAAAGFNVVLKATNHTFDMGYDGVSSELAFWASEHPEVAVIGAADPYGEPIAPAGGTSPAGAYIYEKDGLRVALLNYTDVLNANIDIDYDANVIGLMDEERMASDVSAAREAGADLVVVFTHWGEEYEESPTEGERYWASYLQGLGVDAVVGGHPHVIQPVEVLTGEDGRKMPIFWSVGNFVSTQTSNRNMIGLCVKLHMVKDAEGARIESYEALPTVTHRAGGSSYGGYLLRDYTDDLAAWNNINNVDPEGFSVAWCQDYCARVLGEAYDRDTCSVHGTLD